MQASVRYVITDYDWDDDSRPTVSVDYDCKSAYVEIGVGGKRFSFDMAASSPEDLLLQIESYAEIFSKVAEVIKAKA